MAAETTVKHANDFCFRFVKMSGLISLQERREKAAKEAQAASQREQQSAADNSGAGAGPVTS